MDLKKMPGNKGPQLSHRGENRISREWRPGIQSHWKQNSLLRELIQ